MSLLEAPVDDASASDRRKSNGSFPTPGVGHAPEFSRTRTPPLRSVRPRMTRSRGNADAAEESTGGTPPIIASESPPKQPEIELPLLITLV